MKFIDNRIPSLKTCSLALAAILPLFITFSHAQDSPAPAAVELPATLIGTWQVTEVHIDTAASWRRHYQHNDPRLVGRLFTIGHQQLTSNTPEEKLCVNPRATRHRTTAAELIKTSMAGRYTAPETPTPKDYELPLTDKAPVDVLSVSCKDGLWAGGLGLTEGIEGAWIVALPKDQLAIRWYDETILVLHRLPDNAKPVASFSCNKAATVVENAICASIALAAFDQSVAQAYKRAGQFLTEVDNPAALMQLKATQKQWLVRRNACGADVRCLEKSMEDRLEEIDAAMK